MNIDMVSLNMISKDDINKKIKEDELLIEIARISSLNVAEKYKKEFHSMFNEYCFSIYLYKLERVKRLLLKGFNDIDLVIRMIKTNLDYLI